MGFEAALGDGCHPCVDLLNFTSYHPFLGTTYRIEYRFCVHEIVKLGVVIFRCTTISVGAYCFKSH